MEDPRVEEAKKLVTDQLIDSYAEAVGALGNLDLVLFLEPGGHQIQVNERKVLLHELTVSGVSEDLRQTLMVPASASCGSELAFWFLVSFPGEIICLPVSGRHMGKGSQAKN